MTETKKDIHVTLDNDTIKELERIHKVTRVKKAVILDMIIKDGLNEIRKLNDNFTQFIKERGLE